MWGAIPISRMDPSGLCSEYMGQLSDDDDEGLGDLLYSGPCQFDPVSGAVITSQVEEVAVFGTADPAPTYASENDTSITQDDVDDDDSLTQQQQQSSNSAAPASGPSNGQEPPPACQAKILNATNNQFGTNYTNANVTNTFNFSTGAGPGQGTLNLNINGSTAGVSTGYYPVHWWTYAIGFGPTLHVVGGDVLDSPQTCSLDLTRVRSTSTPAFHTIRSVLSPTGF